MRWLGSTFSEIGRLQARVLGNTGQHAWPDLLIVVKAEHEVPASRPDSASCVKCLFAASGPSRCAAARPRRGAPSPRPRSSRGLEGDRQELRNRLTLLEALGQHAQRKSLHLRDGVRAGLTVGEHAGQGGDLGDPPPIDFLLELDL
jgi:hypothetical protein